MKISPYALPVLPLLFALAVAIAPEARGAADSIVAFNELQYNPAGPSEDGEWIELRNQLAIRVDLSGWTLRGGVDFTFPDGTFIAGGGYVTISKTAGPGLGPFTGNLDNDGETIRLHDNSGRLMDKLDYGDSGDWPVGADGSGATLAKIDERSADAGPANWIASSDLGGTPGVSNFPVAGQAPTVHNLIALDADWTYRDTVTAPPADWAQSGFDDSAWGSGAGALYAGSIAGGGPTGPGSIPGGLVGYWNFDGNVVDQSGAGNHGTLVGASYSNDTPGGGGGQSMAFDNATEHVLVAADASLNSSAFTISMFIKDRGQTSGINRITSREGDTAETGIDKHFGTNSLAYNSPASGWKTSGVVPAINTWQHIAFVADGSNMTVYLDGVAAHGPSAYTASPSGFLHIGNRHNNSEGFDGLLDEVGLWNRALTPTEVSSLAGAPSLPTLETELALGSNAFYFRHEFAFVGNPARTSLMLQLLVDDGAAVYLNGVEVHRENMPAGAIVHGTLASSTIADPTLGTGITIPSGSLVQGTNVLAVEVHQAVAADPDMAFSATLVSTELPPLPAGSAREIVFSEIAAATNPSFQIELSNLSGSGVDLDGYVIGSSSGASYALPAGVLAPGAQLAISAVTLGFTPLQGERLFLFRPGGAGLADAREVTNRLRGLSGNDWLFPSAPSFGSPNTFSFNDDIVINEIFYHAPGIPGTAGIPSEDALQAFGDTWRFNESGDDLGTTWAASAHSVGGNWSSGPGALAYEPNGIPIALGTTLTQPNTNSPQVMTYYFEREFELTQQQFDNLTGFTISHLVDDGAVFYINGVEVERYRMAGAIGDPVLASIPANAGGEAVLVGPVSVSSASAVVGTNRISVEVHQTSGTSSDVVFALELSADSGTPPIPFQEDDEEWIEIYNRGASTVNLDGWYFGDGVSFTFPPGTTIDSGSHLVVASDAVALSAKHPGIPIAGEFSGGLSRSGERVTLRDENNNPVDEVRYYDGGRWPGAADGGGSSLELRDPAADNACPTAWVASDESNDSTWQTYTYQGVAAPSSLGPDNQWRDFIIGLHDAGEVLIDDISVTESPDGSPVAMLSNSDFESGSTGWRFRGTHRHSEVITDPDDPGNQVLRLVATGYTEHMHNNVETTLAGGLSVVNGRTYEISFKAKWISGSNQFNTRLYFNRLPRTTLIDRPDTPGTPGATNSQAEANIGPTYKGLIHSPPVPEAGAPTTVSVSPSDPDGIGTLTLHYSVESGPFSSVAMAPDAEGNYTGQIPGQSAGEVVQFYVEASDGLGATAFFPAAGADSRALYEVEDGRASGTGLGNFRLVMTPDDDTWLHTNINVMSNDRIGCTVIYNESEIFYDTGVRLKSSQRGRLNPNRVGFNVGFNADQLFLGVHRTVGIDRSQGQSPGQRELLFNIMMTSAGGASGKYNDLIKIIAPQNQHTGTAELQLARYGGIFLGSQFEDGDEGTVFEYELIYYPTTADGNGFKIPQPDGVQGTAVRDLGDDKENYRWNFLIKNNRERDDYAAFIDYCKHFDLSGAAFHASVENFVDVDNWLRSMAFAVLSGASDNYGAGDLAHNAQFYVRPDGRVIFLPHDMDNSFSTTRSITANSDVATIVNDPPRYRQYLGHLHDIITTTYNNGYMSGWTSHFATLDPAQNWSASLSHINGRSANVLSQINSAIPSVAFSIDTPSPVTVSTSTTTISGTGWVDVREIWLSGSSIPLELTWTGTTSWEVELPLSLGTHVYTLEALDFTGAVIGADSITIENTGTTELASAANLVISEFMYHPADPSAGEIAAGFDDDDLFEFIELMNIGTIDVDLTGTAFTAGITFSLPSITLAPGERVVLARDRDAFLSRYPGASASLMAGEYYGIGDTNKLSNGGEEVAIVDALGADIQRFTYDDQLSWPTSPDGNGPSLVLIAPGTNPDHNLAANWRPSALLEGNPGSSDAIAFTGDPDADLDGNGVPDLIDHALADGGAPAISLIGDIVRFEFILDLAADDVVAELQVSTDLVNWTDGSSAFPVHTSQHLGTGGLHLVFEAPISDLPTDRYFVRVVFHLVP